MPNHCAVCPMPVIRAGALASVILTGIKKREEKVVRVATLTFHHSINPGAYYQAFLLQQYLGSRGLNVELLNYLAPKHFLLERLGLIFFAGSLSATARNLRKLRAFSLARKRFRLRPWYLTLSKRRLSAISRDYDFVIVGSDILWAHSVTYLGNLDAYFGDYLHPKVGLISYAVSMGPSPSEGMLTKRDSLARFASVSVRDTNTHAALGSMGVESTIVADPTFLVDVKTLLGAEQERAPRSTPYLLVYLYSLTPERLRVIEGFAAERQLEVVATGYHQPLISNNESDVGPERWLRLFAGADYVVTDTFHGTLFAIHLEKPFVTLHRTDIANKTLPVLERLGLRKRYLSTEESMGSLPEDINWTEVSRKSREMRTESELFIATALGLAHV